jgi:hypothetical protein
VADEDAATEDEGATTGTGTDAPDPAARHAGGLPWYRRGVVWFWFVVATVVGAWALSMVAEDRIYRYDVAPGSAEAAAWCEAVDPLRPSLGFWGAMSYDAAVHERRVSGMAAASEVAPEEIAGDLAEVAEAERERQALALGLAAEVEAGREVSPDVLEDLEDEHRVALRRVEEFTAQACPAAG